ncbi:RagB/SusD family nutrient uptake outer membrane protein [Prevotella sp.]|uniref:RagB/SusD family nutrient uptake outer membrane protein n=1 Tax=Prevotella sp. TaxID=59823 RepID=UPI0025EFB118|nr:RagB/SusD family nutrient uptake outer membrane protein [Prevotella sp.]
MKKNIYMALALAATLTTTSCGDFLDEYSQDKITATEVSHLDETLLGSVYMPSIADYNGPSSAYAGFLNIIDDDVNTGYSSMASGNIWNTWSTYLSGMFGYFAWQLEVGKNYESGSVASDKRTWEDLYKRINNVNVILDEIVDMPHNTDKKLAAYYRVQGEAHFERAQYYLMLANLYGKAYNPATCESDPCVPLKLTPYVETEQFHRATMKEVYSQIVDDLLKAEDFLTKSPQIDDHRLYRASAEAADLLLSRVYLYMQNWEEAEKKADAVMRSEKVELATIDLLNSKPDSEDYEGADFLTEQNPEIIFSQGSNFVSGAVFDGRTGNYCVAKELYDLYDDNDLRKTTFFEYQTQMDNTPVDSLALAHKYHREQDYRSRVGSIYTLRAAEAWLNKAEACAMQNGKEVDACAALNELRRNRIANYADQQYTGTELIDQVRLERRKELCFEGQRWFDLRRYAVCAAHPYKRTITHVLNVPDSNKGTYRYSYVYNLEPDDPAYVFAIPSDIQEFDKLEKNPRQKREPVLKGVLIKTEDE